MAIAPNPAPDFCAACGYPLRGPRCDACGVERPTSGGRRAGVSPEVADYDADVEAWRSRDPIRFIGHCVTAEAGAGIPSTTSQDGIGWIFPLRSALLFVSLDAVAERVAIDAPVARVPERQRVPVLRAALELSERAAPARFCLRDDLVLLRRVVRVSALSAAALRQELRSAAGNTERLGRLLSMAFDARPAFTEEQRANLTWASAGRSRPLKSFSIPPPPARSLPPPPPASQRPAPPPPLGGFAGMVPPVPPSPPSSLGGFAGMAPPSPPSSLGALAGMASWSTLGGVAGPRPPAAPQDPPAPPLPPPISARINPGETSRSVPKVPESASRPVSTREQEGLPDILSPLFAAAPSSSSAPAPNGNRPSVPGVPASMPSAARISDTPAAVAERRNAPHRRSSPHLEAIVPPVSVRPPEGPESEGDAQPRKERSPQERLCQLLRDAQALATALSFQDRAGVMLLLVRSTVFRAILEHGEALPSAVAHLYRSTAAATRDLAHAEAAGRRVNPALIAEPALHAMERLVSARAQVSEEKPLQIEQLTSATHAREHLSRYLREIERAPSEPALRHFLALGALSELLVRARLPAKTHQRLREIVSYAHREGPKGAAIDLMMTALSRIVTQ